MKSFIFTLRLRMVGSRMAYANAQEQRFRVLNGLTGGQALVPGQKYKIVVQSR